jgi:hypothetical protein
VTELLDIEEPTKKYWILFMHSYLIGFVFQVAREIYENIYRFKLTIFCDFALNQVCVWILSLSLNSTEFYMELKRIKKEIAICWYWYLPLNLRN